MVSSRSSTHTLRPVIFLSVHHSLVRQRWKGIINVYNSYSLLKLKKENTSGWPDKDADETWSEWARRATEGAALDTMDVANILTAAGVVDKSMVSEHLLEQMGTDKPGTLSKSVSKGLASNAVRVSLPFSLLQPGAERAGFDSVEVGRKSFDMAALVTKANTTSTTSSRRRPSARQEEGSLQSPTTPLACSTPAGESGGSTPASATQDTSPVFGQTGGDNSNGGSGKGDRPVSYDAAPVVWRDARMHCTVLPHPPIPFRSHCGASEIASWHIFRSCRVATRRRRNCRRPVSHCWSEPARHWSMTVLRLSRSRRREITSRRRK